MLVPYVYMVKLQLSYNAPASFLSHIRLLFLICFFSKKCATSFVRFPFIPSSILCFLLLFFLVHCTDISLRSLVVSFSFRPIGSLRLARRIHYLVLLTMHFIRHLISALHFPAGSVVCCKVCINSFRLRHTYRFHVTISY